MPEETKPETPAPVASDPATAKLSQATVALHLAYSGLKAIIVAAPEFDVARLKRIAYSYSYAADVAFTGRVASIQELTAVVDARMALAAVKAEVEKAQPTAEPSADTKLADMPVGAPV